MLCPALATLITLNIRGRKLSTLPWKWGNWRSNLQAYLIPFIYITSAYLLAWTFGLGGVPNTETIAEWANELGLAGSSSVVTVLVMVGLLATIKLIGSLGWIVGEELGWRGFLVWELRKVMPFGAICIFSGLIWAFWHLPLVVTYGGGDPLFQMANFTLMITSMSVIMTYFTFKSGSFWPAVMFHAAHNIYVQEIFTPLTIRNDLTPFWIDEYGVLVPLTVTIIGAFYWRKAKQEGL